jgi:beta-galactosidase/beta-glucuronidase
MFMTMPRSEYPRPQFRRDDWLCLNGQWTCQIDYGLSGLQRGWMHRRGFRDEILVPFCPESELSGLAHTDFIPAIWYHRVITAPPDWSGTRILLHFGAVDYECEAFIDGRPVGRHYGASASFAFDITAALTPGAAHDLVVYARDDIRSGRQPAGKQSVTYDSQGATYTRVTGIWQTVWMEAVNPGGLTECAIVADVDNEAFLLHPAFSDGAAGFEAIARTAAGEIAGRVAGAASAGAGHRLALECVRPWTPRDPHCYELELICRDANGRRIDTVHAYAGLRTVRVAGDTLLLNNEQLYARFVLDQGYYPRGIWTAPSDDDLRNDIQLARDAGFNGARLHQKVFEERYHYWADRMGFLTWAESPNWGMDHGDPAAARNFLGEWPSIVRRDRNHPSIIAWTPFNETPRCEGERGRVHDYLVRDVYALTHELDPTRPVNACSGWHQRETDLFTAHNYEQDAGRLARDLRGETPSWRFVNFADRQTPWAGQPYFLDEFGGAAWPVDDTAQAWGYGEAPRDLEELIERIRAQVAAVCDIDYIAGWCYTQLYDIEQERNGLYTYERKPKFDMRLARGIFAGATIQARVDGAGRSDMERTVV